MGNIFHPNGRIIGNLRIFCNQFPGHHGNIPGRCHMIRRIRQAAAIHKIRMVHPQALRPLIHLFYKGSFIARNILCHRDGRVVSGGDDNTFNQRFHRLDLSLLKEYLGAAHGFRVGAGRHLVLQMDFSRLERVENQDQRHNFRNAGRIPGLIRIFLIQHRSRRRLHQKRGRRTHLWARVRVPQYRNRRNQKQPYKHH